MKTMIYNLFKRIINLKLFNFVDLLRFVKKMFHLKHEARKEFLEKEKDRLIKNIWENIKTSETLDLESYIELYKKIIEVKYILSSLDMENKKSEPNYWDYLEKEAKDILLSNIEESENFDIENLKEEISDHIYEE